MTNIYAMEESALCKYLSLQENLSNIEAITKNHGLIDNSCYEVKYYGSVGVISISGIITRHADMLAKFFCGGSSGVEEIAKDFESLLNNPKIKSIILDFDTPGGAITGVNELAEIIYNARGNKPIKAYVTGMACSAGYFLAAACDEIIIDEMGQVGSIGVMRVVSKQNEKSVIFKSSQSPMKNVEAESELGKAEYQSKVDYLASIFIDKVAKYRGITADEVINRGNKGGVLVGAVAVTAGLADRLGSMDSLIAKLNGKDEINQNVNKENMIMSEIMEEKVEDRASIEAQAVAAERKRVADLMAINVTGCEAIVKEAIEKGISVAETNARIVAFMGSDEYKANSKATLEHVTPLEPVIAGADIPSISEDDAVVNSMIELSKNMEK